MKYRLIPSQNTFAASLGIQYLELVRKLPTEEEINESVRACPNFCDDDCPCRR